MARLKKSDLRERILELLQDTDSHPSASWVFDRLRTEFPRVAVGTVYRNLNILTSEGLLQNINFNESVDRYDANLSKHYHFICEKCESIFDLDIPFERSLEELVREKTEFQVLNHRLDFYGVCTACRDRA